MSTGTANTGRVSTGALRLLRRVTLLTAALAIPTMAVSCSLPTDEQVTPIDADDLGDLGDPTTTTTTAPTTLAPDPAESDPTTTTTTVLELDTDPVRLFYTIGSTDDMKRFTLELPAPVELSDVVQALEVPVPEVTGSGYRTAVRRNLVVGSDLDRATLNVELDATLFEALTEEQRRRAIGQMVLTFTSFVPPDAGSIGFVTFTVDGAPISVFLPRSQTLSEVGAPVGYEDFDPLLSGTSVVPETSPATSSPPVSTAPATTAAPP